MDDMPLSRSPAPRSGSPSRPVALALLVAISVVLAACGSSSGPSAKAKPRHLAAFAGQTNTTPRPAPPLMLRDSLGHPIDLRSYGGKAVLITFIYVHCPDVCPLIVGNLHTSLAKLGAQAKKVQIIAVSTDSKGDTPKTVKRFLRQHEMTGKMEYLIGSQTQLADVWGAWGIAAKRDKKTPELVEHSALIYGIGASGRLLTLYPANFKPATVVHDVPLLAAR